jgi:hypothetical protein
MLHAMKTLSEMVLDRDREDVIAVFGQGRLVQLSRIRVELRGGSSDDHIEAASWLALFMPEAVMAIGSCPQPCSVDSEGQVPRLAAGRSGTSRCAEGSLS